MGTMIINSARIHQYRISIKQLMTSIDLFLQPVDGQHNVLEHLLGEGHGPHCGGGGQLHEGRLGWQHPAKEEEKQRMVTKWYHGL